MATPPTDAAQEEFTIAAPQSWITPVKPELSSATVPGQVSEGIYYLLADYQTRVEKNDKSIFRHFATKALNSQGLEKIGRIEIRFDPSFQSLILHSIIVHRGTQIIQKLTKKSVKILQREKELDYQVFDGSKTANVFLEDIRVGDVVEYAYTVKGSNPVFENQQFGNLDLEMAVPVKKLISRLLLPTDRVFQFKTQNSKEQAKIRVIDNEREYLWEKNKVDALIVSADAPAWYDPYAFVQWSEFKDWEAVAKWALPFYQIPSKLDTAITTEVKKIATTYSSPEQRVVAVLQFVQREIRYLGIEIGVNSHAPNPPTLVLNRRFGDCKDKALLSLTMLSALGIKAEPALVNTRIRKSLATFLPTPSAFNHVIVHLRLADKEYWLDPTRDLQSGDLAHLYQPNFEFALVLEPKTQTLSKMHASPISVSKKVVHTIIDAEKGVDQPALLTVTTAAEGANAESLRRTIATDNKEDLQKNYLNFYARYYPKIEVAALMKISENAKLNQVTITEYYRVPNLWHKNAEKKRMESRYYSPDIDYYLHQPDQSIRNAPLALVHPLDIDQITEIKLPGHWDIKPEQSSINHAAFQLDHTMATAGKVVTMHDHYISKADHVDAGATEDYVKHLEQTRDTLGYSLYHYEDAASKASQQDQRTIFDKINWAVALFALMQIIFFFSLARKWYRHDHPAPIETNVQESKKIGGWLILPMLGIIFTPIVNAIEISNLHAYGVDYWFTVMSFEHVDYHALRAPLLLFELSGKLAIFIFSSLLVILFFQRRRTLPFTYFAVFGGIILFNILDLSMAQLIPNVKSSISTRDWSGLVGSILQLAIWGFYLTYSERAKATFVRAGPGGNTPLNC